MRNLFPKILSTSIFVMSESWILIFLLNPNLIFGDLNFNENRDPSAATGSCQIGTFASKNDHCHLIRNFESLL